MKPPPRSISRREFARRAAFGAAGTSLLPLPELLPAAEPAAQASPSAPKLSPQSQAEAESRYQSILAQYPDRFSEEQKADLRRLSLALQPSLDRLRSFTIANGDQPALYLKPLVEREKKAVAAPVNSPTAAKPRSRPGTQP